MRADSKDKNRTLLARVKGKTEIALLKLPFKHFHIIRPGDIQPSQWNPNAPFSEKIVYPLFKLLMPKFVITSVQLDKAMLYIAKHNTDRQLLENTDLLLIAKKNNRK